MKFINSFFVVAAVLMLLFLASSSGYGQGWADDGQTVRLQTSTDNVGVGTSAPIAKLDVNGTFNVTGYNTLGRNLANSHFPYSGNGWAYVSGKGIIFREDAAGGYLERMRISDDGRVGIGTANPLSAFHMNSVDGIARIEGGTDDFSTSNAATYFMSDGQTKGMVGWHDNGFGDQWLSLVVGTEIRSNYSGIQVHSSGDVWIGEPFQTSTTHIVGTLEVSAGTGDITVLGQNIDCNTMLKLNDISSKPVRIGNSLLIDHVPVWDGDDDYDVTWNNVAIGNAKGRISREGSSLRYKENIAPFAEDFDKILDVEVKQYNMKEGYGNPGEMIFGFIAEEFDQAGLKNLVIYDSLGQPDGIKYKKVSLYLLEVVKDQQARIEALEQGGKKAYEGLASTRSATMPGAETGDTRDRIEQLEKQVALLLGNQENQAVNSNPAGLDPRSLEIGDHSADNLSIASLNTATIPEDYQLSHNYPNPFNPETTIEYALPVSSYITIKIYNTLGQIITTLVDGNQSAGYHSVRWDGSTIAGKQSPSGTFIYQMQAGEYQQTRKMVLIK